MPLSAKQKEWALTQAIEITRAYGYGNNQTNPDEMLELLYKRLCRLSEDVNK